MDAGEWFMTVQALFDQGKATQAERDAAQADYVNQVMQGGPR